MSTMAPYQVLVLRELRAAQAQLLGLLLVDALLLLAVLVAHPSLLLVLTERRHVLLQA